jgi:hypothetical protein
MARIDKYDPVSGGFRARLGWAPVSGDVGAVIAVDLNSTGQAIKSVDGTDCAGVVCLSSLLNENDVADVMTDGEIVDVDTDTVDGAAAGAKVSAGAGGAVGAAETGSAVGRFVEAWRLVVRLGAF